MKLPIRHRTLALVLLLLAGCGTRVPEVAPAAEQPATATPSPEASTPAAAAPSTPAPSPTPVAAPSPAPAPATSPPAAATSGDTGATDPTAGWPLGSWVLDNASIGVTDDSIHITLEVERDRAAVLARGRSVCNSYGGRAALDGPSWRFLDGGATSTSVGCAAERQAVDDRYIARFAGVTRWELVDGTLVLDAGSERLVYRRGA